MTIDLPPVAGASRDAKLLDYVSSGKFEVTWATIKSTYNGHVAEFQVFSDALKVGGVRINASAEVEQKIADLLGCSLLTAKLADLIWEQREVTLPPFPRQITSDTSAMVEHSQKIDNALLKAVSRPKEALVSTTGKHWVLDNAVAGKPGRAVNYGWHFEGASYQGIKGELTASQIKDSKGSFVRMIQGRGTCHDFKHVDYSQTVTLVSKSCLVDGKPTSLEEVLKSRDLAPLVSHQGPLLLLRQPGT